MKYFYLRGRIYRYRPRNQHGVGEWGWAEYDPEKGFLYTTDLVLHDGIVCIWLR